MITSDTTSFTEAERTAALEQAITHALNGMEITDLEGRLLHVNPAFLQMWGYEDEAEVLGRLGHEFWQDPQDAAAVIETLHRHGSWSGELEAVRADGSRFIAELRTYLTRDDAGRPKHLVGSFVDVTERHLAQAALARSEETYARAEAIAHIGSWDWDIVSGDLRWSDEIYRIFGQTPQAFGATYQAFLDTIHRLEIIHRLGRAAEFRDNETGLHIIRMSRYSVILGRLAGMDDEEADLMLHASPMHDIRHRPDALRRTVRPGVVGMNALDILVVDDVLANLDVLNQFLTTTNLARILRLRHCGHHRPSQPDVGGVKWRHPRRPVGERARRGGAPLRFGAPSPRHPATRALRGRHTRLAGLVRPGQSDALFRRSHRGAQPRGRALRRGTSARCPGTGRRPARGGDGGRAGPSRRRVGHDAICPICVDSLAH